MKPVNKPIRHSHSLIALYGLSAIAGIAIGLFNPMISVLLVDAQWSELDIGINSSLFFLCITLAAPLARWLIKFRSPLFLALTGLCLTAIAAMCFPYATSGTNWNSLRALMGIGVGFYMVSGQILLLANAPETQRTMTASLHALAFGVGLGVGPLIGSSLYNFSAGVTFIVGGLIVLSGIPLTYFIKDVKGINIGKMKWKLAKQISIPLHAIFAYAIAEATLMTLFPVYMLEKGHSVHVMSFVFSAFVIGGILGTLPIAYIADRFSNYLMLGICSLIGVLSAIGLVVAAKTYLLITLALLAGASLGPIYALAMASIGNKLPPADLAAGSMLFTFCFGVGTTLAPWLSSLVMKFAGSEHLFNLTAVLFVSLLLHLLSKQLRFAPRLG
jgi:MFS family permease